MLQQSKQRAAAATDIQKIEGGAVPSRPHDERNMIVKREPPIQRLQLPQRARPRRMPPILRRIEARNFVVARHGIQEQTMARPAGVKGECFGAAFTEKIAAAEGRSADWIQTDRAAHVFGSNGMKTPRGRNTRSTRGTKDFLLLVPLVPLVFLPH